jgi:hypothetical protein
MQIIHKLASWLHRNDDCNTSKQAIQTYLNDVIRHNNVKLDRYPKIKSVATGPDSFPPTLDEKHLTNFHIDQHVVIYECKWSFNGDTVIKYLKLERLIDIEKNYDVSMSYNQLLLTLNDLNLGFDKLADVRMIDKSQLQPKRSMLGIISVWFFAAICGGFVYTLYRHQMILNKHQIEINESVSNIVNNISKHPVYKHPQSHLITGTY